MMEFYSDVRKEAMSFAGKRQELELPMFSVQTQADITCFLSYVKFRFKYIYIGIYM